MEQLTEQKIQELFRLSSIDHIPSSEEVLLLQIYSHALVKNFYCLRAREINLEDGIHRAQNCIEFLHGCLTDKQYRYDYPEQTLRDLKELMVIILH